MNLKPAVAAAATCANPDNIMPKFRSVRRVMEKPYQHWVGDGFHVYPVFADLAFKEDLSPLLMFDYGAPKKFPSKVGKPRGVGQHPHRGFETVTIAFQGEVEHHDNNGNSGVIGPGDVQWMTAGRGIIHEEYHSKNFTRDGGTLEMCQLWVNLPKKHKMTKPRYQSILKNQIPTIELPLKHALENNDEEKGEEQASSSTPLAKVRLIAGGGEVFGAVNGNVKGPAKTFSPVQMWDVILPKAGTQVDIPYPADQSCIVFVRRGAVQVLSGDDNNGGKQKANKLGPQDVAIMHLDGSNMLRVKVESDDTSLLVMGGEPLNEPIAAQGPFVMNTHEELQKAMLDYRSGKF
ncbi:pirin-like protein [Nitzschia inconspicua]|uniref:Pirin-like protein n=1 Tax=Nitzschia inconspicua TaxID=303405 RepID=A0A9K3KWV3_9STRA|nr:pirin-like protein [Nitzschia inconspicua]